MARLTPLIRVFISSTFADFVSERNALQARVFPRLRDYCRRQGARFLPIDLRWGISEAASLEQRTVRICLEEIRRCREASPFFYFVTLLGDRYGSQLLPEAIPQIDLELLLAQLDIEAQARVRRWYALDTNAVPPTYVLLSRTGRLDEWTRDSVILQAALTDACRQALVSDSTRLAIATSVTEQEIALGIFDAPASSSSLSFFRSLRYSQDPHTFGEEQSKALAQLADLKERLRVHPGTKIINYDGVWEGAGLDSTSIDAFCEVFDQQLRTQIDRALSQASPEQTDQEDLLSWSFARDRLAFFTGRQDALETISSYLDAPASLPMIVTGPSGAGKTTLLLSVAAQARQRYPDALHLQYFVGGNTPSSTISMVLRNLATRLRETYSHPGDLVVPRRLDELEVQFPIFLGLATIERPLILLIDALDQLHGSDLTSWLPDTLPAHTHIIISALSGPNLDALRLRFSDSAFYDVPALPVADGSVLLDRWLEAEGRTITATQRAAILERFAETPLPLYLRLLFEEAHQWPSFLTSIPVIAPTIPALVETVFDRLASPAEHGTALVGASLSLIAAGKNGLTEDELIDVLSQDKERLHQIISTWPGAPASEHMPVVLWARLYADLEALLTEREVDATRTLGFYHRYLEEVVRNKYLADTTKIARHRELADYFGSLSPYLVNTTERPYAVVNQRVVSELAYQQAEGHLGNNLKNTLFDATFLRARIQAGSTEDAMQDTRFLDEDTDVRFLSYALTLGAVVLDDAPEELENQLNGRAVSLEQRLTDIPINRNPHFKLLSHSLEPADGVLQKVLHGHRDGVNACAITPDGRYGLSASRDHTLRVWDLTSGSTIHVLIGHTAGVHACAMTPDGRYGLSASRDQTLRVWDLTSGSTIHTLTGHTNDVFSCAMTPDGRYGLSGSTDETMRVWDLRRGILTRTFGRQTYGVYGCAITPDGRYGLSGGDGLRLWDLTRGRKIRTLKKHADTVMCCAITSDGGTAVFGSLSDDLSHYVMETAWVWDIARGGTVRGLKGAATKRGYSQPASCCAITPDGRFALAGCPDHNLRLWDLTTDSLGLALSGHSDEVTACAITSDGHLALSGADDKTLRLWDPQSKRTPDGHADAVNTCAISSDGRFALSGSSDQTLRLWDTESRVTLRVLADKGGAMTCAISPDGRYGVSTTGQRMHVWELATGVTVSILKGHTPPILSSRADKQFALAAVTGQTGTVNAVAFTPDARYVLSAADTMLRLWDVATGAEVHTYEGHTNSISACAVTPDGRFALSGAWDNTLKLWDLASGAAVHTFQGHTAQIQSCVISPDGRYALSSSSDTTLRLWDLTTGAEVRRFEGHTDGVSTCAITLDGRFGLSGSKDRTLRLWDLASGRTVAYWTHDAAISCVAIHPFEPLVVVGDDRGGFHWLKIEPSPVGAPLPRQEPTALHLDPVPQLPRRRFWGRQR